MQQPMRGIGQIINLESIGYSIGLGIAKALLAAVPMIVGILLLRAAMRWLMDSVDRKVMNRRVEQRLKYRSRGSILDLKGNTVGGLEAEQEYLKDPHQYKLFMDERERFVRYRQSVEKDIKREDRAARRPRSARSQRRW